MNLAVLITCHNRVAQTMRCLQSLERAATDVENTDVHVFLVDDGSTDGTSVEVLEWYKSLPPFSFSTFSLHLMRGNGSLFWAKGMAMAWREALKYEKSQRSKTTTFIFNYFLWLNDDVELFPNALSTLLHFCTANGTILVISGACRNSVGDMTYGAMDERYRKIEPNGKFESAEWFTGNVLIVPHETCQRVGIISDEYSHATGDVDYAMRLKRAGIPVYASPAYVGICEYGPVNKIKEWPLYKRIPLLFKPSMWTLSDTWIFYCKFFSRRHAIIHCLHRVYIVLRG